jgi:hypothetical protein
MSETCSFRVGANFDALISRYRVFQQIDGVDAMPVNNLTTSESDATLTGLPSGKIERFLHSSFCLLHFRRSP